MKILFALTPILFSASCSFVPMDLPANEGINDEEKTMIKTVYSRDDTQTETLWSDEGLAHLMDGSLDSRRTGKPEEHQTSTIALALASVGDDRFSRVLAKRKPEVIQRVGYAVAPMWTKGELDYPLTRKVYQAQYGQVKAS